MYRRTRQLLCLLLCVLLLPSVSYADEAAQRIMKDMRHNYLVALYTACRETFKGYCGMSVGYQLMARGIYDTLIMSNGNESYDLYSTKLPTAEDTTVTLLPGPYKKGDYTLEDVISLLEASNPDGHDTLAVLCFDTGGYGDGEKYGHVLLVYSVYNGSVYWCENRDGTCWMSKTIKEFLKKYKNNERVYHFDGAVCFNCFDSQPELPGAEAPLPEATEAP